MVSPKPCRRCGIAPPGWGGAASPLGSCEGRRGRARQRRGHVLGARGGRVRGALPRKRERERERERESLPSARSAAS
eukprot:5278049-Alexandrium_andersonii.AAC.1